MARHLAPLFTVIVLLIGLPLQSRGDDLPRYKLSVGQELRYESNSDFRYQNGGFRTEDNLTAWVVRQNPDGSWRVLLQTESKFSQLVDGRSRGAGPARISLAWLNLSPDGAFARNDSIGFTTEPGHIFPKLPDTPQARQQGWSTDVAFGTIHYTVTGNPAGANEFVFQGEEVSPENEIYLSTSKSTFYFDRQRGIISRAENDSSQGYGFKGTGHGQTKLLGVGAKDNAWLKQLDQESDVYFAAVSQYEQKLSAAERDPSHVDALLSDAEQILHTAREKVTLPVLTALLDQQIKQRSMEARFAKETAEHRAAVVDKPAADWTLSDLKGEKHSLADYRGKVVVLDFWYRGCGWCMRAMPQVNQLARHFKNQPVAIIGMNTDQDPKDAEFVVQKMGLQYQTLRADNDLPGKYGVQGFPTLLIIDPQGIVRDMHVGYSPDLQTTVAATINRLLAPAGAGHGH